ncbi:Hypothetical predicted protein [Podarcis lilfordi]|uniref:Uncharacterized protein n=1 Tax=Podarcis lilfordi TaxID=74358 RepID=A0AA35LG31_9SAUR|nr:Hypothetical predicted protein [Podarcis lilfordi]
MWCWEKTQSRGLFLLSTFEELIIIGRTSAYDTPDAYEALASQMEKVSNGPDNVTHNIIFQCDVHHHLPAMPFCIHISIQNNESTQI